MFFTIYIKEIDKLNNPQIPITKLINYTNDRPRSPDRYNLYYYNNATCIIMDLANSNRIFKISINRKRD